MSEAGVHAPLLTTKSNGGIMAAAAAGDAPVETLLSGPASGVMGAREVGRISGEPRLIALDMGGTSTDAAVIDGDVLYSTESHVGDLPVVLPAGGRVLDRRRRRLDRVARSIGHPESRPAQRGRGSGAGLLRARRHAADGDGRLCRRRHHRSRAQARRHRAARCGTRDGGAGSARRAARPVGGAGGGGGAERDDGEHVRAVHAADGAQGHRPARLRHPGVRRRRADPRADAGARGRPRTRDRAGAAWHALRARQSRHRSAAGFHSFRPRRGSSCRPVPTFADQFAPLATQAFGPGWTARTRTSPARQLLHSADMRYRGQSFDIAVPIDDPGGPIEACSANSTSATAGSTALPTSARWWR